MPRFLSSVQFPNLANMFSLATLFLAALLGSNIAAYAVPALEDPWPCPSDNLIAPCTCKVASFSIDIECNNLTDVAQLQNIFQQTFPIDFLHQVVIRYSQLGNLPDDIFGNKYSQIIDFEDNAELSISSGGVFRASQAELVDFRLHGNIIPSLDLSFLKDFAKLESIDVSRNQLTDLGTLQDLNLGSLRSFQADSNQLNTVRVFPPSTSLAKITLYNNVISSIETSAFAELHALAELNLRRNQLTTISADTLRFSPLAPVYFLDLSDNAIVTVEVGGIQGINQDSVINLNKNKIAELTEDVFRPIVSVLSNGSGYITIAENPLDCSCTIKWLIMDDKLRAHVQSGECNDGTTKLDDLDKEVFDKLCP